MKKTLVKSLWINIAKTRLCLILDYVELLCIIAVIVTLGFSPGVCCGLILKETQKYFAIIPVLSTILTVLSLTIVLTNNKVEEFYSKCVERIREKNHHIKELRRVKKL